MRIITLPGRCVFYAGLASALGLLGAGCARMRQPDAEAPLSFEREAALRRAAAARPRRILFNNDGGDARVSREPIGTNELLAARTTPLIGSQADTILYDTTAGTFGMFAHRSDIADAFTSREGRYRHNITPALLAQGTDPLQVMIDFARANDFEIFWTMRMNDTHDASNELLLPSLKKERPDLLFGTRSNRPRHGAWSGVDYAHPLIRDLAFRYIEEVAERYDVDGIHMDFFRHTVFFRGVAEGGQATLREIDMMTALLRRIRLRTRELGAARGRPILLAVRAPDCPAYARQAGLDIEAWMEEGLVDLFFPGGYFRLRPWRDSVALGRRYGVRVYPDFSESRVSGYRQHNREPDRMSLEAYRGRAMNAWHAGADGIHVFNMFRPDHPMLREIGDPDTLVGKDKIYFISVRGAAGSADPHRFVDGGREALRIPVLTPDMPVTLTGDETYAWNLEVGEDVAAARDAGFRPQKILRLGVEGITDASVLRVSFNGHLLEELSSALPEVDYVLPSGLLRRGENSVELILAEDHATRHQRMMWQRETPPVEDGLTLTRVEASLPRRNALRLRLWGEARGSGVLGSFTIRTARRAQAGNVPPGFVVQPNGFAYPEGWTHPGYIDNGPLDEDPETGVFAITLPMTDGREGEYELMVGVQNRPAPGTYQRSDRMLAFRIDNHGRVLFPPVLRDVQLRVRYAPQ